MTSPGGVAMTIDELKSWRQERIDSEPGPLFLGLPDRWYDTPRFRCVNGHVSTGVLLTEMKGDLCLACLGAVLLTFPEDVEAPTPHPPSKLTGRTLDEIAEAMPDLETGALASGGVDAL